MHQYLQVSKVVLALLWTLGTEQAQSQASDVSTLPPISIAKVTDGDTVLLRKVIEYAFGASMLPR